MQGTNWMLTEEGRIFSKPDAQLPIFEEAKNAFNIARDKELNTLEHGTETQGNS